MNSAGRISGDSIPASIAADMSRGILHRLHDVELDNEAPVRRDGPLAVISLQPPVSAADAFPICCGESRRELEHALPAVEISEPLHPSKRLRVREVWQC